MKADQMLAGLAAIDESRQVSSKIARHATLKFSLIRIGAGYEAPAGHLFEKYRLGIGTDEFDGLFAEEPV